MKTIEQAAEEFAEKRRTANGRKETGAYPPIAWFKAGVKFASQWISVDEELPEDWVICLTKIERDETHYSVGVWLSGIKQWIIETHYIIPDFEYQPTHWRYIELK